MLLNYLHTLLNLYLETAVWLLAGLILAGLIKGWLPEQLVRRWLDGTGPGTVLRASVIGAPLPLCSCGVLPAAIGLHRAGASRPSTVSFLIATPETGIDSVALSYALLGPVMALIRPLAAIISAIFSGLLVLLFERHVDTDGQRTQPATGSSCCSGSCTETGPPSLPRHASPTQVVYNMIELLDDITGWLVFGLVLAALVSTFVEPEALSGIGNSPWTLLLMLGVGLPLYICATASTPLAAAMLAAGLSPGAVLVFMLAGPATNIASLGLLRRELGSRVLALYLTGICTSALLLGYATNLLFDASSLSFPGAAEGLAEAGLAWSLLQWLSGIVLLVLAAKPLRQRILPAQARERGCCD